MKKTLSIAATALLILSPSTFALEIECENESGIVLKLSGDNTTARELGTGELIGADLAMAYHLSIDISGSTIEAGVETPVSDSLIMMRRVRAIYTANSNQVSLFWNSPTESFQGNIAGHSGDFNCSLSDF